MLLELDTDLEGEEELDETLRDAGEPEDDEDGVETVLVLFAPEFAELTEFGL